MLSELINTYLGTASNDLPDDICWIVVQPLSGVLSVNEAVTRIGGQPEDLRNMTTLDAYSMSPGNTLSFEETETAVSILQIGGFAGMFLEMIEPLSRSARAWVAYWDVNASFSMLLWVDGSCVGGWDPYAPREGWATGLGPMGQYADFFLQYDIDDEDRDPNYREAVTLAVIEAESGVRLDRAWIDREHPAMLVTQGLSSGLEVSRLDD
ncbi:hypothetical protein [Sphaerisporangium fuscum]|uniref:hypothetical protein n=1 Tax=Sphaerisporangium fuscum TaxID=2835868 RepID=UPI001BDC1889|nr:hypothetical protein [Sphaerisporangium fuscum]